MTEMVSTKGPNAFRNGEESGFTLIEMLIVVGIIVALAAVIVPVLFRFTSEGPEGQKAAELSSVQTAMDSMMADTGVLAVNENGSPTASFASMPAGTPLASYLRSNTTTNCYTWDGVGRILTQTEKTGSPPSC